MKRKRKRRLTGKLAAVVFIVWVAMTLVSLQAKINRRTAENAELDALLAQQQMINDMLREDIDSEDAEELYARIARERLGLVAPGELVIVNKAP